jgi:hypothetical protein
MAVLEMTCVVRNMKLRLYLSKVEKLIANLKVFILILELLMFLRRNNIKDPFYALLIFFDLHSDLPFALYILFLFFRFFGTKRVLDHNRPTLSSTVQTTAQLWFTAQTIAQL